MKNILTLIFFLSSFIIYAQSNEQIDKIMNSNRVTIEEASLLILSSADLIDSEADSSTALKYINDKKWYKKDLKGDTPATAGDVSYIFMKAFNLKGGIMYKILPGPRYAAREMEYRKILDRKTEVSSIMSGEDFLVFLSEALNNKEYNK